ncbi:PhzF family phenazine biosynthesis protein [Phenylobacterium sp. Root700]|uniref:PhzF family phenazine biosynthesis protein n=1 Tax=Phenylobacterium sp. Root700 TaxID=1736591 RepID=UPI0007011E63|nr:PhzF family phenazine biosynthesis protein [Phenylobacterium sp. Root700]KRB41316.1 phenazine biosynthesis protein PhzF [Phenylobacterium sp. Root700]
MSSYPFVTLDVFTDTRFGGNPLAVFTDARGLSDQDMQALAAEMNLSETTFILPPQDLANTARVRIFNRTAEMPFAGHPSIGTGWVLSQAGRGDELRLEVPAGIVAVSATAQGATIAAPRPLALGEPLPIDITAACAGLTPADIVTTAHGPIEASVGVAFVFAEVSPEALPRAAPDLAAFRRAAADYPHFGDRLSLHLYAHDGDGRLRARMFAPNSGTVEDPATGSANATLAALLLSLSTADAGAWDIIQGVEMGRPSRLHATARRGAEGITATVGGGCIPVLRGEASL